MSDMLSADREPHLGRIVQFDERSRNWPARALLSADQIREPRTYIWPVPDPAPLDQKNTTECVTFSFTHELIADPVMVPNLSAQNAHIWYRQCKQIDRLRGAAGTSVIAGARVITRAGHYTSYRWCFSEPEAAAAVSWTGPVVFGIPWYENMSRPDRNGFIVPKGRMVGGHAILGIGLDDVDNFYWLLNSWGRGWGDNGRCRILRKHLADLLKQDGEACQPSRVALPEPNHA